MRPEGGRFFTIAAAPDPHLDEARQAAEAQYLALGKALSAFAGEQGVNLSEDDALAALAAFVTDNKTPLVLDEVLPDSPLERSTLPRKLTRLVAKFITTRCMADEALRIPLSALVEGMVLQDALLMRDLADLNQRFSGLVVALDTPILLSALVLTGVANGLATSEGLSLLREAGAVTVAFDRTIGEVRRILAVYEDHLATAAGRLQLYPTEMTHFILTSKLPPSEVRNISATLEKRLAAITIPVREVPIHDARYTLDEGALTAALADLVTHETDTPRIRHDVDVVAGILTMRAGRTTTSFERSGAVFCTTSGRVISNVQKWHREQGEHGVPPIVHQHALTSLAWLKKPAAARGVKLHELAAVCVAALRPTRVTWEKFTDRLRKLRDDGALTDDETVAIVASEMAEPLLAQLDDEMEPDSDTITEAIERVRDKYRREAEAAANEAIAQARSQAAQAQEAANHAIALSTAATEEAVAQARGQAALAQDAASRANTLATEMQKAALARATSIARPVASGVYYVGTAVAVAAAVLSFPGVFDSIGPTLKGVARTVVAVAIVLGAYSQIRGPSLKDLRARLQAWLVAVVHRVLYGRPPSVS